MNKDQRDFRYKIYQLINDIANNKNILNERDFYKVKGDMLNYLTDVLFK